ncbi:MAG TPA: GNAT family N-acetyltransferase [Oligoflexia bacterium]|nr:GNAT family N-acetyltransferase [Oligoflexia bacterium]HMP48352.1 GNAT family N-acetyltransferase [Oligoflexia bacterium]
MKINIRPATQNDLSEILNLYHELHESEPVMEINTDIISVWSQILSDDRLECFVAEVENKVIATCILDIVPNLTRNARPFGVLQNVVTSKNYRGMGVGKVLNKHALDYAWSKNCYQVLVQTGRPKVTSFYESLGFRRDKIGLVAKHPEACCFKTDGV